MPRKDPAAQAAYAAAYQISHRAEISARKAVYRAVNRERLAAERVAYRATHKDEIAAREAAYDPTKRNERQRTYRAAHHDEILARRAAYRATVKAVHPDRVERDRQYRRERSLAAYGVDGEWFRTMLVGQAGRCAICGFVMEPGRFTHVDHDHVTGKARGLLCQDCNLLLGHANENPRTLAAAIRYLGAA